MPAKYTYRGGNRSQMLIPPQQVTQERVRLVGLDNTLANNHASSQLHRE